MCPPIYQIFMFLKTQSLLRAVRSSEEGFLDNLDIGSLNTHVDFHT